MKFYKKLPLNRKDPMSDRFAVHADDKIVTTSKISMQVPSGDTSYRPKDAVNGDIRYNVDIPVGGNFEGFINGTWSLFKTNAQQNVTQQVFTNGNYFNSYFGPLKYNIDASRPQNIMVYVENVPQIANINYTLARSNFTASFATSLVSAVSINATVLPVNDVSNFSVGNFITGKGIAPGTTISSVDLTGTTVTINSGVTVALPFNSVVSTSFYTPAITAQTTASVTTLVGTSIVSVNSVADFNVGNPISGIGIAPGTTIASTSATSLTITLSQPASGIVAETTVLTTSFTASGTYIYFKPDSLPVPFKPVVSLLGFDGYVFIP
jgi:hypothetical protein